MRARPTPFAHTVLAILLSALLGSALAAEPCADYPLLEENRIGSLETEYKTTMAIAGNIAYLGGYSLHVAVVDLSDPAQPELLGEIPIGVNRTEALQVTPVGDTAYVAGAWGEIPILDISDPAHGAEVGSLPVLFSVQATAVVGDRLYAASYGRRTYAGDDTTAIYIFDISDPRAPVQLAEVLEPNERVHAIEMRDKVMVVSEPSEIRTLDLTDPAAVTVLDTLDLYSSPDDMQFEGDLLYLACVTGEFHIVDASDPADLVLLSSTDLMSADAQALWVSGSTALVTCESGGLRYLDVSDPVHPSTPAAWMSDGRCYGIAQLPDQLVIAASSQLMTLELDPATGVKTEAILPSNRPVRRQAVDGDLLYVLDPDLRILDISQPTSPVPLGTYADGTYYGRLSLDGSVLYLGALGGGVIALDVSDPTAPVRLSRITDDQIYSLHAANGLLALGPRDGYLQLYDVADPAAPVLLGVHDAASPYRCYGVAVTENFLYMTTGYTYVLDISDPTQPHTVTQLRTGYGLDLVADGKWIYTPSEEGLSVLRFTEPDLLEEIAAFTLPGDVQDLHLDRMLLSAVCGEGGARMYDVSDPSATILVAGFPAYDDAISVVADPDRVFIGNHTYNLDPHGGIEVFPAPCEPYVSAMPDGPPSAAGIDLSAAPNPFNPRVRFRLDVPQAGPARLAVYDMRGRCVAVLLERTIAAGEQHFEWNGRDAAGRALPSGAYIARLECAGRTASRRVTLLR